MAAPEASVPRLVPLRQRFHRHLDVINDKVVQLFSLVSEGIAAATEALLSGDGEAGRLVVERDGLTDSLYRDIESLANQELALQSPVATDLRFLLSVLRIVPELERSHDLVEHIARRAIPGLNDELTPRTRGLLGQMGAVGVEMWRGVSDAWYDRDGGCHQRLDDRDEEMDDLHANLMAELASGKTRLPVAMDMALVARFYERLGDHAVNVAKRICYLAGQA
ncbi:MAG TPA: phosphate signaling complex protein PhoU [Acidimicrobiales bacterium]|nr:phosphate signaling complex protein PhoU [Acidimicrobiales bacterium]